MIRINSNLYYSSEQVIYSPMISWTSVLARVKAISEDLFFQSKSIFKSHNLKFSPLRQPSQPYQLGRYCTPRVLVSPMLSHSLQSIVPSSLKQVWGSVNPQLGIAQLISFKQSAKRRSVPTASKAPSSRLDGLHLLARTPVLDWLFLSTGLNKCSKYLLKYYYFLP